MIALAGLFVALLLALAVMHRELLRRAFLRAEDPRAMGALRIAFTACAIVGVLEPVVDAGWLFSDEGMFLREGAREFVAGDALAGFEDGGFVDAAALWHYLMSGSASLLHFCDTPTFITVWTTTLMLSLVGLLLGWHSRVCAWTAFLLLVGLLRRNNTWIGGEQVYCAGLFALAVSRCGHAYSVDNWLRCRALRRRDRLSEPGGPGAGAGTAAGLAAIYRRIPAWPRLLLVGQVALIYGLNGLNKSGQTWWDGTAIFYVLQGDWARFDGRPLVLWLGDDAIAWMTWFVRAWETLFPLVVLGLILRFIAREQLPPPRFARWLWLGCGATAVALAGLLVAEHPRFAATDTDALMARWWIGGGCILLAIAGLYHRLHAGISMGRRTFDRETLHRWLLGRRIWLTGALVFTAGLVLTLNVGAFPLAALTLTLALFRGEEVAAMLARLRGCPVVLCEDRDLRQLHHDDAVLPMWSLAAAVATLFTGNAICMLGAPAWAWRWVVLAVGFALLVVGRRAARSAREDSSLGPWAYGPLGRLLAGSLCAVHVTALVVNAVPIWKNLEEFRRDLRRPTAWWLGFSGVYQYWAMFSVVPRNNTSIGGSVIDADGMEHDLPSEPARTGVALWNRRQSKIYSGMLGDKHRQTWHARAVCRRFAREHGGAVPQRVTLVKRVAPIQPPWQEVPTDRLARFEADATTSPLLDIDCRNEPHGQWPAQLRERLGLLPSPMPFVPTADKSLWPAVRDKHGALWPYDEWLALLACSTLWFSWRRRARARRPAGRSSTNASGSGPHTPTG